jgi:uncharacterized protein
MRTADAPPNWIHQGPVVSDPLLIVGASGRAAAESAGRAGFVPLVVDAFGDDDTRRAAACRIDVAYPKKLVDESEYFPPADWIYVGGLENSPAIVDRLSIQRRLLGVGGPALRRVRDPAALRAELAVEGVRFPEIRTDSIGIRTDGTWLLKCRRSAGGLGVSVFSGNSLSQIDGSRYFERRIEGPCYGATFLGNGRESRLVGVVEQFVVDSDPRRPFLFGGAVGPIDLSDAMRARLGILGGQTASRFGLSGLFGIDFILESDDIWMLEVNPRYTASVELLEHALDRHLIGDHVRACREGELPADAFATARNRFTRKIGKRIVYAGATRGTVAPELTKALWKIRGEARLPAVADIPTSGSSIEAYSPLATVFADGAHAARVTDELNRLASEISRLFRQTCGA